MKFKYYSLFLSGVSFANLFWLLRFGNFFNELIGIRYTNVIFITQVISFFGLLICFYIFYKKEKDK